MPIVLLDRTQKQLFQGPKTPQSEQQSLRSASFEGVAEGDRACSLVASNLRAGAPLSVFMRMTVLVHPASGSA